MKKKLIAKLEELLRQGYETVTVHQVLEWIRAFSPVSREKDGE